MRRRQMPPKLPIHAEVLAGGPSPDPHDALPALQEWEDAWQGEEAERWFIDSLTHPEPPAEPAVLTPVFEACGVLDGVCRADAPDVAPRTYFDDGGARNRAGKAVEKSTR